MYRDSPMRRGAFRLNVVVGALGKSRSNWRASCYNQAHNQIKAHASLTVGLNGHLTVVFVCVTKVTKVY